MLTSCNGQTDQFAAGFRRDPAEPALILQLATFLRRGAGTHVGENLMREVSVGFTIWRLALAPRRSVGAKVRGSRQHRCCSRSLAELNIVRNYHRIRNWNDTQYGCSAPLRASVENITNNEGD
jgi:hypothetical protein